MTSSNLTPPLKWPGGKRWLAPLLKANWDALSERRLVEPFAGGLAVALALKPKKALLNDTNPYLINFYLHLHQGLKFDNELLNCEQFYYSSRERLNQLIAQGQDSGKELAQLFYYLNRTGFNGLCRFNNSGYFNVPFGRYSKINYKEHFLDYKGAFHGWTFKCGDFSKLRKRRDDFLYLDPPYDTPFTKYSKNDFNWDDQQRLVKWVSKHQGPILASNQATPRILELYLEAGFEIICMKAPRMISCNGNRAPAIEMIAYKNLDHQLIIPESMAEKQVEIP